MQSCCKGCESPREKSGVLAVIDPCEIDTADPEQLREFAWVSRILALMADLRAIALEARLAGYTDVACKNDNAIERLYKSLPKDVKW